MALQLMLHLNKIVYVMSGIRCVVYTQQHKVFTMVFAPTSQCLLLIAMTRITLVRALQLILLLNIIVNIVILI